MKRVWIMGEILVEIMRPRAGMTLDKPGEFLGPYPSGAPAIFIDTVARLGHKAGIIGGVGEDEFGECVLRRLQEDGVDCQAVGTFSGAATAVAFVTYFQDGSRKFIYHIDRTPAVRTLFDEGMIDQPADLFHIMGCSLMANDAFRLEIFRAMQYFKKNGARITFDPNIRAELLQGRPLAEVIGPALQQCSVLLPGAAELSLLSGETAPERGASRLFADYPLELIVLKQGGAGCTVFTRQGDRIHVPAYPIREVDPTGAGDCFDAGFLCAWLEGKDLAECARTGAAAGALNTEAFGPMEGNITRERIAEMLQCPPVSFREGLQ